jgi:hypothetical protein
VDPYDQMADTVMALLSAAAADYRARGAADDEFLRDASQAIRDRIVAVDVLNRTYTGDLAAAAGHFGVGRDEAGFVEWARQAWRVSEPRPVTAADVATGRWLDGEFDD